MEQRDSSFRALRIAKAALDTEPNRRESFITAECGDDRQLDRAVRRLLQQVDSLEQAGERIPDQDTGADTVGEDPLVGTNLGPYLVAERIGRGGMGDVYLARREGSDFKQTVAIKLIRRGFDFADVQARFLRERRILARLEHPGLTRFIDGGVAWDGRPWFALEYVQGENIGRWCDQRRLDVRARVRLFLDVCAAVQYAHTQLVVHRDLKPGNILVEDNGTPRLLDFGVSRLLDGDEAETGTLTMVGRRHAMTPEYAAPEQFIGDPAGVSADVYALGVILYELVAGVLPYPIDRHDLATAERLVLHADPEPLTQAFARALPMSSRSPSSSLRGDDDDLLAVRGHGSAADTDTDTDTEAVVEQRLAARAVSRRAYRSLVRGDLSRIVGKALAKEPERRYPTVEAFADDLQRWLHGVPVRVSGQGIGYRIGKFVKRNRISVIVVSVLSLALVGSLIVSGIDARQRLKEVLAEREQAQASKDFLGSLFTDAGPGGEKGIDSTARDILLAGIERMKADARLTPQTRSDLLLTMGESLGSLSALEDAAAAYALAEAEQGRYEPSPTERFRLKLRQAINLHDIHELDTAETLGQALIEPGASGQEVPAGLRVTAHALMANIALRRHDTTLALERLEPALAITLAEAGKVPLTDVADTRMLYANLLTESRRFAESDAELDWVLAAYRSLDAHHPVIGKTLSLKAMNLQDQGLLEQADAAFSEAVGEILRSLGPDSQDIAMVRGNYSILLLQAGEPERAVAELREAIRIDEQAQIRSPPMVYLKLRLGRALIETGDFDAAQAALTEALSLAKELEVARAIDMIAFQQTYLDCLLGDQHAGARLDTLLPEQADEDVLARGLFQLGQCQERIGRRDQANAHYRRALDLAGQWPVTGAVQPLMTAIRGRLGSP